MAFMIQGCLATTKNLGLVKLVKFVEQAADNMVVMTNLAICINLALIVEVR